MNLTDTNNITGLILAGGRAQRMGGIDKGLIPFRDKPLIYHAIERLRPQVGSIQINANRNHDQYGIYGYPVLADAKENFAGPLAGFLAGLTACNTSMLLTAPCDSPLLPVDLAEKLFENMKKNQADLVYASSQDQDQKLWAQPVFCLMKKSVLPSLEKFMSNGGRKIDQWFDFLSANTVIFENEKVFTNVNTPEELATLEKEFQTK